MAGSRRPVRDETRRAWRAAEIANAKLSELSADLETQVESRTPALATEGARGRLTNRLRSRDGDDRWLSWTLVAQAGLRYCIARDVTQDHERGLALAEAEAAMRQAQKMEAIGQMTGGIAHDFNNLLATIKNCLEMVGSVDPDRHADEVRRFAALALRSVDRGVALTQRMLAFARKQPLTFAAVDVNALVRGLEEMLVRLLGRHVEVRIRTEDGLFPSYIDANQFESGLVNLVINARDAIGERGAITIETGSLRVGPTGLVGSIDLAPGDYVVVSVSDDGMGMTPEVIARAFEPFYSTKTMGQGTGLGLAMVHGFAKQSGGTATIFSERGVGTTVKLFLPRSSSDPAPRDDAPPGMKTPAAQGQRLLVVEDEDDLRAIVVELLRVHGFEVEEAATAERGIELWQARAPFDAVITDIRLPGMTGRELAQRVRAHDPEMPILLMTGYDTQAASPLDSLDQRTALISKPFAIEAFVAEARKLAGLRRRAAH